MVKVYFCALCDIDSKPLMANSSDPGADEVRAQLRRILGSVNSVTKRHRFLEDLVEAKIQLRRTKNRFGIQTEKPDVWDAVMKHFCGEGKLEVQATNSNLSRMLLIIRQDLRTYYQTATDDDRVLITFPEVKPRLRAHYEPTFTWRCDYGRTVSATKVARRRRFQPGLDHGHPQTIVPRFRDHPTNESQGADFHEMSLKQHWIPRARGAEGIHPFSERWYFTGRTEALRRIVSWLNQPTADGPILAVTGNPGSGKSAVLSLIVVASDLTLRKQRELHDLLVSMSEETQPPPGCIYFAYHLKQRTLADAKAEFAGKLSCEPDELFERLTYCSADTVMLFDGIDEAVRPEEIATNLIRPLSRHPNIRILAGVRRAQLGLLGGAVQALDLDSPEFSSETDVANYVEKVLTAREETGRSLYRHNAVAAKKAATAVCQEAKGNFLVAHVTAKWLIELPGILDLEREKLPSTAEEAFRAYLRILGERTGLGNEVREVLRPLAYAQGQGLPDWLWARLTGHGIGKVHAVIEAAADFVWPYLENDCEVFRLYHEKLAECLRDARRNRYWNRRIAQLLIERVAGDWVKADHYTRNHLAAHAAAAGILDQLMSDVLFIAVCVPSRLAAVSGYVSDEESRRRMSWLFLTLDRLSGLHPEERLSQLQLTAKQQGADDLAAAVEETGVRGRWRPLWAHWLSATPHQILRGHKSSVTGVAISKDVVVSCGWDGTVRLWDRHTGQPIREPLRAHEDWATAVAISGDVVVSGGHEGTVRLWDRRTGQPIGTPLHAHDGGVFAVAISGDVLVSGGGDCTVRLWDHRTGQPLGGPFRGHNRGISAVAISGDVVVSASGDATVRLWECHSATPIGDPVHGHAGTPAAVAICGDAVVFNGTGNTVRLWDARTGQPIGEPLRGHVDAVSAVAINEEVVVSGGDDCTVRLWDRHTGRAVGEPLYGHEDVVTAVAISGELVVSGSRDSTVRLWDRRAGQPLGESLYGHENRVLAVAISGDVVVSGGDDCTVRLWHRNTGRPLGEPLCGHESFVTAVAINGDVVVSGGYDETVRLWDRHTGRPIGEPLRGHENYVTAVAINGDVVVSGGYDCAVRLWDRHTGQPIGKPLYTHYPRVSAIAISPDLIASGGYDHAVKLWNPQTGQPIGTCGHRGKVNAVAISGDVIVSGGWDGTVRVWDRRGKPIRELLCEGREVIAVAIDEDMIVSGGRDNVLRLWDRRTGAIMEMIDIGSHVLGLAIEDSCVCVASSQGLLCIEVAAIRHLG